MERNTIYGYWYVVWLAKDGPNGSYERILAGWDEDCKEQIKSQYPGVPYQIEWREAIWGY